MFRIGLGTDIHPFKAGRKLILAGVEIPSDLGLDGHSDADVVFHALGDGLLGAAGLGDLGEFFPMDAKNKDRSSREILAEIMTRVYEKGFEPENVDLMVMAEQPKISPYKEKMKQNISEVLRISMDRVGVKATTCEGLGFVGRREGVCAQAVVLLKARGGRRV